MPGGKKGEGLLEQLDTAIGRAGSTRTERGPQQATRFTQKGNQRVMRGPTPFLRIVPNLTTLLGAVATEDGGGSGQSVP
jgi:hypothetical protein